MKGKKMLEELKPHEVFRWFEEITRIKQSSDDLFVDPLNGDFHIKPGAGFAGTGNAGDPRWY